MPTVSFSITRPASPGHELSGELDIATWEFGRIYDCDLDEGDVTELDPGSTEYAEARAILQGKLAPDVYDWALGAVARQRGLRQNGGSQ